MWEPPTALWRRLKLGREEYLQRLVTTLICDGDAPPWNTPQSPGEAGRKFLRLLDEAAHGSSDRGPLVTVPETFVDEYLLPKLEEGAANGWPDWAVLWSHRVWIIELKTEAGSHRANQLPYYVRLAAALHPDCMLDLSYITGPLTKPAPALADGQRYSHLTWHQVVPLIEETWGHDKRPEVGAYVQMVSTLVSNLSRLRPSQQRDLVLGTPPPAASGVTADNQDVEPETPDAAHPDPLRDASPRAERAADLLSLARATGEDGRQRGAGAQDPEELEALRDQVRDAINSLPAADATRFVLPWLWEAARTDGKALTPEGSEFGYELRFSRYKTIQVRP